LGNSGQPRTEIGCPDLIHLVFQCFFCNIHSLYLLSVAAQQIIPIFINLKCSHLLLPGVCRTGIQTRLPGFLVSSISQSFKKLCSRTGI
jgi:hypothetical protein